MSLDTHPIARPASGDARVGCSDKDTKRKKNPARKQPVTLHSSPVGRGLVRPHCLQHNSKRSVSTPRAVFKVAGRAAHYTLDAHCAVTVQTRGLKWCMETPIGAVGRTVGRDNCSDLLLHRFCIRSDNASATHSMVSRSTNHR